jgi:hypothetical protein
LGQKNFKKILKIGLTKYLQWLFLWQMEGSPIRVPNCQKSFPPVETVAKRVIPGVSFAEETPVGWQLFGLGTGNFCW